MVDVIKERRDGDSNGRHPDALIVFVVAFVTDRFTAVKRVPCIPLGEIMILLAMDIMVDCNGVFDADLFDDVNKKKASWCGVIHGRKIFCGQKKEIDRSMMRFCF